MAKTTTLKTDEQIETTADAKASVEISAEISLEDILKKLSLLEKLIADKDKTIEKQSKIINAQKDSNTDGLVDLIQEIRADNIRKGGVRVTYIGTDGQYMQKLSNGTIILLKDYGDSCLLSLDDAQRLINEYAGSFKKGKLMINSEHNYLLEEKGIDIKKINYKPLESIQEIHLLDEAGIEKLYNSLLPYQKDMLKSHIFKMFSTEREYLSIDKLRLLNKLSQKDYQESGVPYFKELAKQGGYKFLINTLMGE